MSVSVLKRNAGASGEIRIARAVDECLCADGAAARFRLHDQRRYRAAVHHHITRDRVEEYLHASGKQQIVGGAFEGRNIIRAYRDAPLQALLRLVQPAETIYPIEKIVGNPVHHLSRLTMDEPEKSGEVGDASRGAHPSQEAVTLDEENVGAVPGSGGGGGEARRAATDNNHVERSEHRCFTNGFGNGVFPSWLLPAIDPISINVDYLFFEKNRSICKYTYRETRTVGWTRCRTFEPSWPSPRRAASLRQRGGAA